PVAWGRERAEFAARSEPIDPNVG
ncbi:MAG: hypothetical protein QOD29_640, partial [Alphaproteobacteria bacterium]|nr:hypothetical protein [Alphaproteobacteria bacterium]